MPDQERIEAQVARLLSDYNEPLLDDDDKPATWAQNVFRFVINVGAKSKVKLGDKYVIYSLGEEIKDPAFGTSLGRIEIVRGRASVVHVQETMSILRSSDTKTVRNQYILPGQPDRETVDGPLRVIQVGDYARPV